MSPLLTPAQCVQRDETLAVISAEGAVGKQIDKFQCAIFIAPGEDGEGIPLNHREIYRVF